MTQRVQAGDHLLVIASVTQVAYLAESGEPLIRFAGRYLASGPADPWNERAPELCFPA